MMNLLERITPDVTLQTQIQDLPSEEKELTDQILALISGSNIKIGRVGTILSIVEAKIRQFIQSINLNGFYKGGINKQ